MQVASMINLKNAPRVALYSTFESFFIPDREMETMCE